MMTWMRWRLPMVAVAALFAVSLAGAAHAQERPPEPRRAEAAQAAHPLPLPPTAVTKQSITIPAGSLGEGTYEFTAKVGTLAMKDASGNVQAEIGFVSYTLDSWVTSKDGKETRHELKPVNERPITVAINGGPGAASAYLNLLAIGPWRLPLNDSCGAGPECPKTAGKTLFPSAEVTPVDNEASWLPFTDLVFIDPPGTGYSRVLGNDELRKRFYSVDGDIDILSAAIARWMRENDRLASPKFYVGESYGGFRGPLLAERLQTRQGIGFNGLMLISPVLDFNWIFQSDYAAWEKAGLLPSYAAANLELQGKPFDEATRKDVETYAAGEFLTDMMRGLSDENAVARLSERVAAYTGLDPALVRRMAGRVDIRTFQRERLRAAQKVLSVYDTAVATPDPDPTAASSRFEDPMLTGLTAPLTTGMVNLLRDRLGYKADDFQYQLLNGEVNRQWDWRQGHTNAAESVTALSRALALDPSLRVVVMHGAADLVTPYFTDRLLLNQLPPLAAQRVQLMVYPGGHMFYSRDESRKLLRRRAQCEYGLILRSRQTGKDDQSAFRFSDGVCF